MPFFCPDFETESDSSLYLNWLTFPIWKIPSPNLWLGEMVWHPQPTLQVYSQGFWNTKTCREDFWARISNSKDVGHWEGISQGHRRGQGHQGRLLCLRQVIYWKILKGKFQFNSNLISQFISILLLSFWDLSRYIAGLFITWVFLTWIRWFTMWTHSRYQQQINNKWRCWFQT